MRDGPIDHGPIPENTDWIATVRPVIEARISKYQAGEIQFNLMAVIQDKMDNYRQVYCLFVLIWASRGIPVIQYWPSPSYMSYMEDCAEIA